jgi:integrase/recombinase XerD
MRALIDQFLDYVSLERGLSPNTRAAYASDLAAFARFLAGRGIASINAVRRSHLVDFLMESKERNLRASTISRRLVSIRVLFRYLQQEGLAASNPAAVMDSPKLWKILPDTLTVRDVDRLLAQPDPTTPLGARDRAILELLYATGLRVSELASLAAGDIRFEEGYVRCLGKGRKERLVPFGAAAREALRRYADEARPALLRGAEAGTFFVSRRRRPMDRRQIWRMIRARARGAGIGKNVHPHTLRHSFASHLLANEAPLRVIQEMLGHADIATTQIYTHVDAARLKSVHERFHPRA